jgi:hypothetical protein
MERIEMDDVAQYEDAPTKTRTFDNDEPTAVAVRGVNAGCLATPDEGGEEFGLSRTSVMAEELLKQLTERTRDEGVPDSPPPRPTAEPPPATDAAAPQPASAKPSASAHEAEAATMRRRHIGLLVAALLTMSLAVIGQNALHRRSQRLAAELPPKPSNLVLVMPNGLIPLASMDVAAHPPAPTATAAGDGKASDARPAPLANGARARPTSAKRAAPRH